MKVAKIRHAVKKSSKQQDQETEYFWNKELSWGNQFKNEDRAKIYQQLYVLIDAGVDFNTSLTHLINQASTPYNKELLMKVQGFIQKGLPIHEAMEKVGDFTKYEIFSIKIGEESGRLQDVLSNLSEYYEEKVIQRREIVSALSYPVLIISAAMGAVLFMIFFIIPVFEEIFSRFGGELPALTQSVVNFSLLIRKYFIHAFIGFVSIGYLTQRALKHAKAYAFFESLVLATPYLKTFVYYSIMSKFSNSMGLLLSAKIPLVSALEMNKKTFKSERLKTLIDVSVEELMKGQSYSESLSRSKFYDSNFKVFMKIGEETNRLDYFFKKLSNDYRDSIKHQTTVLNAVLEPVLIIILGAIVGVILIAMYLPMFELSSQMSFPS